jgi:predicted nucleic acid-binding protein
VIVISDTSPLCALAQIEELNLLQRLFGEILLPAEVLAECRHPGAPGLLQEWAGAVPDWVTVAEPSAGILPEVAKLDPGEAAAITLASRFAEPVLLLIDERAAAGVARQLGLAFTGTLGLLVRGHQLGLLDFDEAVRALRATQFRFTQALIAKARQLID